MGFILTFSCMPIYTNMYFVSCFNFPSICIIPTSLCLPFYINLCSSPPAQMKMPAAPEEDNSTQMTGKLGQRLWFPQPGLRGHLALLEGMALGSKEEVAVPDITRAGAGIWGRLLVPMFHSSSSSFPQP